VGTGPLSGVRVVDACAEIGRSAAKLLAELGADVVRVQPGHPGRSLGADTDAVGGVADWWFDANCRRVPLDLGAPGGRAAVVELLRDADVVLESGVERLLDPVAVRAANPAIVHVRATPWGDDGPRAGWRSSDFVAAAAGGILSVTGLPDEPITIWGRQMDNITGFYAAAVALAGLARVRAGGDGVYADLSQQHAVLSCTEHLFMFWWYRDWFGHLGAPSAVRQASLHWIRAYEVVPCARGACMVSPSAGGVPDLLAWMRSEGFATEIPIEATAAEWLTLIPAVMAEIRRFALTKDATELYERGQALHVPFGEALTVRQAVASPQLVARDFFRAVEGAPDRVRLPGGLSRFAATPLPTPAAPADATVAEVLASWATARPARVGAPVAGKVDGAPRLPLDGLRVLDFTHVLAGPFATRILADLGADVIKLQTEDRCQGAYAPDYPYPAMWNRNKRAVTLDMRHPDAVGVLRRLVEQADIVIDNFSAGVLAEWGAGPAELEAWNPRIISISMTGCGEDGPWKDYVTFAPTVHALCGLTALTGPVGRIDVGPGVALNDHLSGIAGAVVLLAALEARDRTGAGQHLDMSQLEVASHLVGPALLQQLATGEEPVAAGIADPFDATVRNGVHRYGDDTWVAWTTRTAEEADLAASLVDRAGTATVAAESMQAAGIAAAPIQGAAELEGADPQVAHRDVFLTVASSMFDGTQRTDRFPARLTDAAGVIERPYVGSPALGEHNFEVYEELLGWDADRIATAMADGLFG
jgi:crotonobetainyl-CoA:carnitine CoA-transferase CaiB-like acyl-CoA transferase